MNFVNTALPTIATAGPPPPVSIWGLATALFTGNLCCIPNPDTIVGKVFPSVNQTIFPMFLAALATQKYTPDVKTSFDKEYDYIIIGAGSAGCAVAARLSEKECVKVLLLEAGGPPSIVSEAPGIARLLVTTDMNWNFYTERQNNTGNGLYKNKVVFPSGKTIGGSSNINGMLYIRGNHKDYDAMEANGCEGWGWKGVFPYFLKLEDNTTPHIVNNGFHGVGGPVTVAHFNYTPELKTVLLEGIKELGHNFSDPNGPTQLGYSDFQANMRRGQRCSAAKAYLVPNDKRPNLHIVAHAYVKRISIVDKRANGVYFQFDGCEHFVKAKREVILSAGTINSAKILMLSGVGPKETLQKHNIPVHADLPVGKNFIDHIGALVKFFVKAPIRKYFPRVLLPLSLIEYCKHRSGPLSSTEAVYGMAFFRSNNSKTAPGVPNYQLYWIEGIPQGAQLTLGMKPWVYLKVFAPYRLLPTTWCVSSILHPESRGYVSIRSNDPYAAPILDPQFLSTQQDIEDIKAGMKACKKMGETNAMRNFGVRIFKTVTPGCEPFVGDDDATFECEMRSVVFTANHQVGTCKMGSPNDTTTVTDPKLRVHGILGLRVIDASIFPLAISGNTNIPAMMVGEKGADMIKETITEC